VKPKFERIDDVRVLIPRVGGMRVDGLVFADERLLAALGDDTSLTQVANVAHLPGIVGHALAMPDIHMGYGFPIGGVAAFGEDGVVSPGGVGYDINCGVRLLRTALKADDVRPVLRELAEALYRAIPSGVGSHRKDLRLSDGELDDVMEVGAAWAVGRGFGSARDVAHMEAGGSIADANPGVVSKRARERGRAQLGTIGSGNHFVEVGRVARVFDAEVAGAFGLFEGDVTVLIHTGSRGFGYQVCDDHLEAMQGASRRYGIELPDRQLCAAPLTSPEARDYLGAMAAAANFAFANRQVITHWVREVVEETMRLGPRDSGIEVVYDVCHNIAKFEEHEVGGRRRRLCVHRKGATRAFPAGHAELPAAYRDVGQPVIIPGDMGRRSYVLVGEAGAMRETWGTACHGAGRVMSRSRATREAKGRNIVRELEDVGIYVRASSRATVVEEMPEAYKDVSDVVDVVARAGLARRVAELKPMAVVKG
jgi:tRNA-splicing ligase RtcB